MTTQRVSGGAFTLAPDDAPPPPPEDIDPYWFVFVAVGDLERFAELAVREDVS
jgi:hypothetical protein